MGAESEWKSLNGGPKRVARAMDRAARGALTVKAQTLVNAWRRQMLSHPHAGFTTGNFSTGTALNAITKSVPIQVGRIGEYVVHVGTPLLYHLFWELGHMNLFTGRYERVETLRPAIEDSAEEMKAAFARVFRRMFLDSMGVKSDG